MASGVTLWEAYKALALGQIVAIHAGKQKNKEGKVRELEQWLGLELPPRVNWKYTGDSVPLPRG